MDETLGAESGMTIGSIDEILRKADEVRQHALLDKLRLVEGERDILQKQAQGALTLVEKERVEHANELDNRSRGISNLAQRYAHRVAIVLYSIVFGLLLVCFVITLPAPFPSLEGVLGRYIFGLSVLIVFLAGVLSLIDASIGKYLKIFVYSVERKIQRKIERRLTRNIEREVRKLATLVDSSHPDIPSK